MALNKLSYLALIELSFVTLSDSELRGSLISELLSLCRTELLGSFGLSCMALSKSELRCSLISELLAFYRIELLGSYETELRGS